MLYARHFLRGIRPEGAPVGGRYDEGMALRVDEDGRPLVESIVMKTTKGGLDKTVAPVGRTDQQRDRPPTTWGSVDPTRAGPVKTLANIDRPRTSMATRGDIDRPRASITR